MEYPKPADSIPLRPWIRNADATLEVVTTPSGDVPLLIPDRAPSRGDRCTMGSEPPSRLAERAWVTCLWSGSAGYAIDEWTARIDPRWAQGLRPLVALTAGLSWILGPWRGAVQVGSWPLSTSLRETLQVGDLLGALDAAIERFPDRPIALRHVFSDSPPELLGALADRSFQALPARVVYDLDADEVRKPRASHLKRDLALLARSDLSVVADADFTQDDIEAALRMYQAVYRRRHSLRNPDYCAGFVQWARQRGLIELLGLRSATGQLRAFAARHDQGLSTSVPMLGYDLEADRRDGLYRQLVAALVREAGLRKQRFDFSSGAGDFKRKRGFEPRLEMTMLRAPSQWRLQWPVGLALRLAAAGTSFLSMERLIAAGA